MDILHIKLYHTKCHLIKINEFDGKYLEHNKDLKKYITIRVLKGKI